MKFLLSLLSTLFFAESTFFKTYDFEVKDDVWFEKLTTTDTGVCAVGWHGYRIYKEGWIVCVDINGQAEWS